MSTAATAGIANVLVVLCAAVPFGADVFFLLVGRPALERAREPALAETMGRIHEAAGARLGPISAVGTAGAAALAVLRGAGTAAGLLALLALAGLLAHFALILLFSLPVNRVLIRAARSGTTPSDARALQRRWDRVLVPRVAAAAVALVGAAAAG